MSPQPFDVVGVGANAIDFVYRLPAYPEPSGPLSKLRISAHERSPGGQTATTLSACASLGLRASYIGTISTDDNGRLVREALARRGVDLSRAISRQAPNAFAVILTAQGAAQEPRLAADARERGSGAERIVLWDRAPGMALMPADLPGDLGSSSRLIHVDDVDIEAGIAAARTGIAAGLPVTSDIEIAAPRTSELLDAVTVPIFAEHVPLALTGEPDVERALRALRRRHAGLLCVTLGARGAVMLAGDQIVRQEAFPVDAVDTTGAGDVFRAGVIVGLLRGDSPAAMLRFACAAAAVSCTRRGAIASVPTLADVNRVL